MRHVSRSCALALGVVLSVSAAAQQPAATPDPITLKAARDVVAKMQGDRSAVLGSVSGPMIGLIQQLGVREQERAQALVQEVVLPTLTERLDELLDIQARTFASVLGTADLQAIASFYDTPAGRNLVAAQPRLAQAQVTGITQWLTGLMPGLQAKLAQTIQARGWGAGAPPKPR